MIETPEQLLSIQRNITRILYDQRSWSGKYLQLSLFPIVQQRILHQIGNQYFSKPHISHIKIESEILQTKKYEVLLTDRTEIDFDKKGNWLEVDCKKSAVPEALIPVPVKEYVKANFPREIITKIERGRTGVEIELGNDYSLKFNKKGKFVSMDD